MHLSVFQSHCVLGILQMPLMVPHLNMFWFDDMIRTVLTAVSWPGWLRKGDGMWTCCCPSRTWFTSIGVCVIGQTRAHCCVLKPTERKVLTVYLQGKQMFQSNGAKFWSNLQQLKGHAFKRFCRTQAVTVRILHVAFQASFLLYFLLPYIFRLDKNA